MRRVVSACLLGLLLGLLSASPAPLAQDQTRTLRVATRLVSPLVVEDHGELTGFSIDLWRSIAAEMKVQTDYLIAPDVSALLDDVRAGKADLGIAAISITAERDKEFDFSQPMLEAGLQILVRGGGDAPTNPLLEFLRLLSSPMLLVWLGIAVLLILIPSHVVWFVERRHKD